MTRVFIFGYNRQQNLILWDRVPLRCGKERTQARRNEFSIGAASQGYLIYYQWKRSV